MSLTIPPRTGAPLAPTSFPAPKAAEPTRALSTRLETGLGTLKDGYEQSLNGACNGANKRAPNPADSSFDVAPGKVADLVRDSRAARQSGRRHTEGRGQDISADRDLVPPHKEGHAGGSNWRKGSREISTISG